MSYKDPARMAEYMRQWRAAKSGKVSVNPNVNRKPVNPNRKISQVSGSYENGYWVRICPACNHQNRMDPKRSYRPADRCEHFRRLLKPGTASEFIFSRGLKSDFVNQANLPKVTGTSGLSNFGILYRKGKDDFTLVYLVGDKIRPLRSLKTGLENGVPELAGLKIIREKMQLAGDGSE